MEVTHGTTLLRQESLGGEEFIKPHNKQEDITHQLKVTKESSYRALQQILAAKPDDGHTRGYQQHKNNRCPKADVLFSV